MGGRARQIGQVRGKLTLYAHQLGWKEREMGKKRRKELIYAHNLGRKKKKAGEEAVKMGILSGKSSILPRKNEETRYDQIDCIRP